ncbi:hypothetical protein SAMN05216577_111161 [Pseudomonas citronellolis]|uniref:DUF1269 domain-containing protein n=1 Tax=Pseudomonas citronellolis TaxID=53408 RepID=A0AAQ1HNA6_9PSED|nr:MULTISPECIES: hypothetical protein [Pseudomonas]MBG4910262.1 hypothetical protein [Pseudomonas aeruginosa]KWR75258.1 hypothetical protein RN02_23645 [Pseudomonas sp. PI1]TGC30877.1 hypothetical protein CW310_07570 [Pseudomonas citronellolis]UUC52325.1 hypothetical protein NOX82_10550 [Pseudomonas citronellolis]SFC86123.1 hypothetical protein SAMN05216577_111161 [Pseudomonas citronellolis]
MAGYRHQVSGVFAHRAQAESARVLLSERGIHDRQMRILGAKDLPPANGSSQVKRTLSQMLASGAVGTLLGLAVSTLTAIALTRTNAGLFSGPPLVLVGWGSALGALLGGMVGTSANAGQVDRTFRYAIAHGDVVLLAETLSERETLLARDIIEASLGVGTHMDISLV